MQYRHIDSYRSKVQDIYVGDGLPLVPAKLVERIEKVDYVEMYELIPKLWVVHTAEEEASTQRGPITRAESNLRIFMYGCSALRCMLQWYQGNGQNGCQK